VDVHRLSHERAAYAPVRHPACDLGRTAFTETVRPGADDRARTTRYLATLDELVTEARTPQSETVRQAADVLLQASRPDGTPSQRRAQAEAAMAEIARIAAAAPTIGERDAALEMNGALAEIIAVIDRDSAAG
jgi:hypothetical protein